MTTSKLHISTLAVQAGYNPENAATRVPCIAQSTTYAFDTAEQIGDVFDLKDTAHIYSRISNPTVAQLEEKINALEGGTGALALSSGHAAVSLAIMNLCIAGDHFVTAKSLYGGTINLFMHTLKKYGISCTFVDQDAPIEELEKAIQPNTKLIFAESLTNPGMEVLNFKKFSKFAEGNQLPLIIDNTFPTPILCQPFQHGANIVIHSTTKFIDGHATSLGGIIIDGGNFDWTNGKFPDFTEPDETYNGAIYAKDFKENPFVVKARTQLLRDFGPCMSPFNAFMTYHGCQTLALRMEKHSMNTLQLAEWLEDHEHVEWVRYAGLESSPYIELSKTYLPDGASGVLAFGYKGGLEETKKVINKLKLAKLVVHVGDIRTGVVHPASMTHRQLTEEQLLDINITQNLIRISVGIEDIRDIIADFEQAL
ncbi:MAG: O-acetylhomoserine aminocarboxypropyltransferase/cysteine synthase [Salinivirgaceae bacterium]|jgi:O-acetylhomoserine (thiol)-lyase|nr:O-acetylhomoserine aminocarboxypropyltransferase/cysteine synthase [Salinivirgaceae bacterium]